MKKWRKQKKILPGLLLFFLAIQVIQPEKNRGPFAGPLDMAKTVHVPDSVMAVLKRSCYDCHSNNTIYPWYGNIAPVSWWVALHVKEGKDELNFTTFREYSTRRQAESMEAIAETVEKEKMPLESYLFLHGNATLTEAQKQLLIKWATAAQQGIVAPQTP